MFDNLQSKFKIKNAGFKATAVAVGANLLLVIIKIVVGLLINSLSLIADGFDSTLDIVGAFLAYIGLSFGEKEADSDHHYGHHKVEALFSIIITVLIFLSALTILDQAIKRIQTGFSLQFDILGLISAIFSITVKFSISIYVIRIGKEMGSGSLVANGKNYQADAIASLLVSIAMIGAFFNLGWLDTVMAILICIFFASTAYDITKESLGYLTDVAPPQSTINNIKQYLQNNDEVKEVHDLRLRYLAQDKLAGDVHLLLDPDLTLKKAHDIAERIKSNIKSKFNLISFIIHIEPNIPEEKRKTN